MSAPNTVAGLSNKLDLFAAATSNKITELEDTLGSVGASTNSVEADLAQTKEELTAQVATLSSALEVSNKRLASAEGELGKQAARVAAVEAALAALSGEAASAAPPAPLFGAFIAPFKGVAENPADVIDNTKKGGLKVPIPTGGPLKYSGQLVDIASLTNIMQEVHSWGLSNDNKWPYGWWTYLFTSEAQALLSEALAGSMWACLATPWMCR